MRHPGTLAARCVLSTLQAADLHLSSAFNEGQHLCCLHCSAGNVGILTLLLRCAGMCWRASRTRMCLSTTCRVPLLSSPWSAVLCNLLCKTQPSICMFADGRPVAVGSIHRPCIPGASLSRLSLARCCTRSLGALRTTAAACCLLILCWCPPQRQQ